MNGPVIYEFVKFWLPVLTGFGMVFKAWRVARGGVTKWADSLLNNHLTHIQIATEQSAKLLVEVRDDHRVAKQEITGIRSDLHTHEVATLAVQQQILTGIEVLKDRK